MKKVIVILLAVIVVLCPVVLTACSSVNQLNSISVSFKDYEQFVYNIYEDNVVDPIGTMTYTFERINAETTLHVGPGEYTVSEGAIITTEVNITAGTYQGDHIQSVVLVKSSLLAVASYKVYESQDEARAYTSYVVYGNKKVNFTINGKESSHKVRSCYDNDSLYTLARASRLSESSYSLSVAGVDNLQGNTRSVSFGKGADVEMGCDAVLDGEGQRKPINCYHVVLSTSAQYGKGAQTHIYLAIDKSEETQKVLKVPVKIVEGTYSYILASISLVKPE